MNQDERYVVATTTTISISIKALFSGVSSFLSSQVVMPDMSLESISAIRGPTKI